MTIHPKLVNRTCYHKYEIEPGLFTPGNHLEIEPKRCLDELGVPRDLSGLRALDIGTWDGPYTFELERRGAQVTALDIQDPDITVFNAVKQIKNSSAMYIRGGIYDAHPETLGTYDLILFVGVYYHLKNPVLAFQRIRRLITDTGTLFIEGASVRDHLAGELNKALGLPKSSVRTTAEILDQLPLSYYDTEQKIYSHWSNWWFPTTRCLTVILQDSGFRGVNLKLMANAFYNYSHRRLMGRAEPDLAKPDPTGQKYEHGVIAKDVTSQNSLSRRDRVLSRLPPGLHPGARWMRRLVTRLIGRD